MVLLVLFAFVAGAGTALSPCVLPVLPALLASAGSGGRRRPLGVIAGLTATFTIAIVALASVVDGVGLPGGTVRTLAVAVLLGFGVALLVPSLAARVEAPLSRLARFGPRGRGDGFWSGLLVGAGLGFVYAPCAGPILAAVVSVSATQGASGELVAVALGYAAGSALVLLLVAYGGGGGRGGPRPGGAARARRGDGGDRGGRGRRPRRSLPDRPRRRLPRGRGEPDARARALGRGGGAPRLPAGVGRPLPRARADDRRRAHARVRVRARRRERARGDRRQQDPVPGCAGQRIRHLECLG